MKENRMKRKKRVFLAFFLALAMIMQYSFAPQSFMAFAEESSEPSVAEQSDSSDSEPSQSSAPASSSSSASSSSASSAPASSGGSSSAASSSSSTASSSSSAASDSSSAASGSSSAASGSSSAASGSSSESSGDNSAASSSSESTQPTDNNGDGVSDAADTVKDSEVNEDPSAPSTEVETSTNAVQAAPEPADADTKGSDSGDADSDQQNDSRISGSKTADPTELGEDRTTTVTLSLPALEYQNEIDIVFVADNSNSTEDGKKFSATVTALFNTILEKNPALSINVGVVKYRGYATDCISLATAGLNAGLTLWTKATEEIIQTALAMTEEVPGRGSNMHSGLTMANEWLEAHTSVEDSHKYVVFLTDGKSYIWNNDNGDPTTYYFQYYGKGTDSNGKSSYTAIMGGGVPSISQTAGERNKEAYSVDVLDPSGKSNIYRFVDDTDPRGQRQDYSKLYNSTDVELTSDTGFEQYCYYAYGQGVPAGKVTAHKATNGPDLFRNYPDYQYYYEFTPNPTWQERGIKYYEANPYEVINNPDGSYSFNENKINPAYYQYHVDHMQKALYKGGHLWTDIAGKYNTAAIYAKTSTGSGLSLAESFGAWVKNNSKYGADAKDADSVAAMFDNISNDIIYLIGKGTVKDTITDDFDLKDADSDTAFKLKVGDDVINLNSKTGDSWYFGDAVDYVYPYVVHYDASKKLVTWDINVPVENAKRASLSYGLILKEGSPEGYYDTNVSAILDYVSSDGKQKGSYTFEKPKVHYTEKAPAPTPGTDPTPDPDPNPTPDPTPDPDPNPTPDPGDDPTSTTGGGTTGGNGGTTGGGGIITAAAPGPAAAATINNPAPTAAPTTTIDEPEPPLALNAYWALINLLCAIATALLSVIMLIRYFGKKEKEDEETGEVTEIKRKGGVRLASIIPAVAGIVAFILTEDMTLPMQMVDKWTLLMVVILAVQVIVAIAAKKKKDDDDDEETGDTAYAAS